MLVLPKALLVNGVSAIAHPTGIEVQVKNGIEHASSVCLVRPPTRVLILGASSGYGFASWLVSVFAAHAKTVGVFLEKESTPEGTATAGWYNVAMLQKLAHEQENQIRAINADVFSLNTKRQVAEIIRRSFGKVDCVIYSIAAPRRLDSETNILYRSVLKPIGKSFIARNINIESGHLETTAISPATEEEINSTIKVMGGEDWYNWIDFLFNEGLLEDGCQTFAYSYIGSEVTAPIYRQGTIGRAKEHLEQTSQLIDARLKETVGGRAFAAVTRSAVTQASSAVPSLNLYLSCLLRVAKTNGTYEDCFAQVARLFRQLYGNESATFDEYSRLRLDEKELDPKFQDEVKRLIEIITDQTIDRYSDYANYHRDFLQLYGFEVPGVDYAAAVETSVAISSNNTYQISDIAIGKSFTEELDKPCEAPIGIAVVGMGCHFAGAKSPRELWENSLLKRQQFRDMPPSRFSCDDYYDPNPDVPDKTYSRRAALIDNFNFDWKKRRITKETYESTDPVQWLALEVAEAALVDAALDWKNINRDRVGVYVGNVQGEFTRASNEMRPRWSYVQSAFLQAAKEVNYDINLLLPIMEEFERYYKVNLPAITKDSVAGELANVVAGRICNYFDFHGGAYAVDAACASSLIAIINAVKALQAGEIDVAIAGGVDITLGTAFMVGFAKAGVFAKERMRVFDEEAEGFVPGEGAGFVVLRRKFDADYSRDKQYAEILGYGISTDGKGGIATPSVNGQLLALKRAYQMAGVSPLQLDFIETHGSGTSVGDSAEITAIRELLLAYGYGNDVVLQEKKQIALSSIKSTVGHTKGAAGSAGFIEAVIGLNQREIPPIAGCINPNKAFKEDKCGVFPAIYTIKKPIDSRMIAGVSSMGFGGINAHIVLANSGQKYQHLANNNVKKVMYDGADQLAELFIFSAPSCEELLNKLKVLLEEVRYISYGELVDLSYVLTQRVSYEHVVKASLVVSSPSELIEKIELLITQLQQKNLVAGEVYSNLLAKAYLSVEPTKPRIAFLFPGQGSQQLNPSIRIIERYPWARAIAKEVITTFFPNEQERVTAWEKIFIFKEHARDEKILIEWQRNIAEIKFSSCVIIVSCLVWYEFLTRMGVNHDLSLGHSYGDFMSLYTVGAYSRDDLLKLVLFRSELICQYACKKDGLMISLQCDLATANNLLCKITGVITVANVNAPDQIIFSGEEASIKMLEQEALALGIKAKILPVITAFHSPLMEDARQAMINNFPIENITFNPNKNKKIILSTIGNVQEAPFEIRDYIANHFTTGVKFIAAANALSKETDLAIEVGTGRVVSGLLTANNIKIHNFPIERQSGDSSAEELLAFLHIAGVKINWELLFDGRHHKQYVPSREKRFLESPFSKIKSVTVETIDLTKINKSTNRVEKTIKLPQTSSANCYGLLVTKIAQLSGFDEASIKPEHKLLQNLGFDSILITRLSKDITQNLAIDSKKIDITLFQDKTIVEISNYLELLKSHISTSVNSEKRVEALNQPARPHLVRNYVMISRPQQLVANTQIDIAFLGKVLLIESSNIKLNFNFQIEKRWSPKSPDIMEKVLAEDLSKINLIVAIHQDAIADLINQLWMATKFVEKISSISFLIFGNLPLLNGFIRSISMEYPDLKLRALRFAKDINLDYVEYCLAQEFAAERNVVIAEYAKSTLSLVDEKTNDEYKANIRHVWYLEVAAPIGNRPRKNQITDQDVILVTGGGKGITSECALRLAATTGGIFILLGRSPSPSPNLLARFTAQGVKAFYYSCDVQNREMLGNTIRLVEEQFGPITVVIHGAGINQPRRVNNITLEEATTEIAPKLEGMSNLCDIFHNKELRLFVVFSSVAAVTGIPGNAWYSLANELIEWHLKNYQTTHAQTEILALCYGVWNEVGMGVNTDAISKLGSMGVDTLSVEEGTGRFVDAMTTSQPDSSVIITASLGSLGKLAIQVISAHQSQPIVSGRFLEEVYELESGVYGLCGARLSLKKDLYLNDHRVGKHILFPSVFGLEAMAEVAALVLNSPVMPQRFENIYFNRAIVVSEEREQEIRIMVVADEPNHLNTKSVEAKIFFEDDGFKESCFTARIYFGTVSETIAPTTLQLSSPLAIDTTNIYKPNTAFFHGHFYRRLNKVYKLDKKNLNLLVSINTQPAAMWLKNCFAENLSIHPLLGDLAALDAVLQVNGFFVFPEMALPIAIDSIVFHQSTFPEIVYAEGKMNKEATTISSNIVLRAIDGEAICSVTNYKAKLLSNGTSADVNNDAIEKNIITTCAEEKYSELFCKILQKINNKIKQLWQYSYGITIELLSYWWFTLSCKGTVILSKELPAEAFILVSNHVSYADWLILYSVFRRIYKRKIHFLAKERLFKNYWWNILMEHSGAICVKNNNLERKALKKINFLLKRTNHIFGIFPEGKRSISGKLITGYDGAANIAVSTGAKIVPVGLKGFYEMWPPNRKFPRPYKVEINIGEAISLSKEARKDLSAATQEIMLRIAELTDQEYEPTHSSTIE